MTESGHQGAVAAAVLSASSGRHSRNLQRHACSRFHPGRFVLTALLLAAASAFPVAVLAAEPPTAANDQRPAAREENEPEPWSLDDIKDVCEAVQFVAITIAIGAGLYWLYRHMTHKREAPRLELHVDVRSVGTLGNAAVLEIAAVVSNHGSQQQQLADFGLELAPLASPTDASVAVSQLTVGPLLHSSGGLPAARPFVDAGARYRFVWPVQVTSATTHLLATVKVKCLATGTVYTAAIVTERTGIR